MRLYKRALLFVFASSISFLSLAQDKIFRTDGDTIYGKVVEVSQTSIKFTRQNNPESPYYLIRSTKVDSIVYANGQTDEIAKLFFERREPTHLRTKNTYSLDILSPVAYSVTQWYERRVWKGKLGIRIPLYLSYKQNFSPGFNVITRQRGYNYLEDGFAIATGVNPKFYLNKHRIIRAFAGPEADLGYTAPPKSNGSLNVYDNQAPYRGSGNFLLAGLAGLNINPVAHFNVTLEAGLGYNWAFTQTIQQEDAVWRVGLSLGGNF